MDERISPEALLKSFLANNEYGLWRYDRSRFNPPRLYHPFDERRAEIRRRIESLKYLELVNPYLFPGYDEYEKTLSDYFSSLSPGIFCDELNWPECVQMPRSVAYPGGGFFSKVTFKVPADLFNGISDRFFDKCDIRLDCIYDTRFGDTFWMNLNPGYRRKESLAEWSDGKFRRIVADGSLIVMDKMNCRRQVIPAVMAILVQAWVDHCEALRSGRPTWASMKTGRKRFANNIDELMFPSGDACLVALGRFIKQMADLSAQLDHPLNFKCQNGTETHHSDVHRAVETSACQLMQSAPYKLCVSAWEALEGIGGLLETADSRKVVEVWNRCARQKAACKEDILSLVTAKYLGTCPEILSRLAANITYDRLCLMVMY